MIINRDTIDLVKKFEGLKLNAYLCPAKIWTIGYGNTFYENGTKIKPGDLITQVQAVNMLHHTLEMFAGQITPHINHTLTENQFGALVSFAYNVGINAFKKSTLLKKVNLNPEDDSIGLEFMRWNKAGGKVLNGLTNRRLAEKELYFTI